MHPEALCTLPGFTRACPMIAPAQAPMQLQPHNSPCDAWAGGDGGEEGGPAGSRLIGLLCVLTGGAAGLSDAEADDGERLRQVG